MKIKNFKSFNETKSGELYDYGCVMVYLNIPDWERLVTKVPEEELYMKEDPTYGYETSPHCTILYGLHSDVSDEDVASIFRDVSRNDISIEIDGIGFFSGKDYDVVKMNVKSDKLTELNSKLTKLPHTTDYPDYHPHITMSYVLKGNGQKYVNPNFHLRFNRIDKIVYSKTNGEELEIPLR